MRLANSSYRGGRPRQVSCWPILRLPIFAVEPRDHILAMPLGTQAAPLCATPK